MWYFFGEFSLNGGTSDRRRKQRWRMEMSQFRRVLVVAAVSVVALALVLVSPVPAARADPSSGYLRVGHFVPGAAAAAVSLDGRSLVGAPTYQQVTSYAAVPAGEHTLSITVPGSGGAPAQRASATETIVAGQFATALITVGSSGSLTITSFTDDLSQPAPGDAKMRFIKYLVHPPNADRQSDSCPRAS